MCLMYGPPETDQPEAWFAEMDRLVKNYYDTELDKAADLILRTHRGNRFPSVSEMLTACVDARESIAPKTKPPEPFPDWMPEVIANADELIRCKLGQRAAAEGWVFALHTFCRKHKRLPMGGEIAGCIEEARGFDVAYQKASESADPLQIALRKLGDSMLRMQEYLGEIAHGRVRSDDEIREYLKSPKAFRKPELVK